MVKLRELQRQALKSQSDKSGGESMKSGKHVSKCVCVKTRRQKWSKEKGRKITEQEIQLNIEPEGERWGEKQINEHLSDECSLVGTNPQDLGWKNKG